MSAGFLRLIASTTIGAVWAVIVLVMPQTSKKILNICTYTLVSFIMIKVCIGKCMLRDAIKGVLAMLAVAFLYGGIIHFLYYYTFAGYLINTIVMGSRRRILLFTASVLIVLAITFFLEKRRRYSGGKYDVVINIGNEKIRLKALIDTGNLLVDPFSGRPVTIVEKQCFEGVCNKINDYTKLKYHMIPFSSLGCENGVIEIILADNMYIYNGKRKWAVKCAAIGLCKHRLSADGKYNCLINMDILE